MNNLVTANNSSKLLATNKNCEKEQFFEQHGTPATKSWLFWDTYFRKFGMLNHTGGSRESHINLFIYLFYVKNLQTL